MTLFATQPFKTLYALGAISFELACLPVWLLKHLTVYGRAHPSWTFRQSLALRLLFNLVWYSSKMRSAPPLPLTPGKEKERFVVMKKPSKSDEEKYFQGPLVSNPDVHPEDIGGTWYPAPLSPASDLSLVTVILHIHGGAYVIGDGRTEATGFLAKMLLKGTRASHVLAPQYRLSRLPATKDSNPFPAALQDSLTAYLYLLHELRVPPANIILSGDSAGANNAIALLRYIVEFGADAGIPHPSAALLWSPWIDTSDDTDSYARSNPNYKTDYLNAPFTAWGARAYGGLAGVQSLKHKYAVPKGHPFKTPVPMYVHAGSLEVLYFDDEEFAQMMERAGNTVVFDGKDEVPHDVLLVGNLLGFEEVAARCAKRAGDWLKEVRA